jgi:hypothetical protein
VNLHIGTFAVVIAWTRVIPAFFKMLASAFTVILLSRYVISQSDDGILRRVITEPKNSGFAEERGNALRRMFLRLCLNRSHLILLTLSEMSFY